MSEPSRASHIICESQFFQLFSHFTLIISVTLAMVYYIPLLAHADATQLNSTSSCRHVHSVNNSYRSVLNVMTQ